jgi:hypothetical protein
MKIEPTLEGGLRIDAESPVDWHVLMAIVHDARSAGEDLADRLGGLINEDAGAEDWQEFVVPELREGFDDQLRSVAEAIGAAMHKAEDGIGSVRIRRTDGPIWYGAINQARLALEDLHKLSAGMPETLDEEQSLEWRSASARSYLYGKLQHFLFDLVLK